MKAKKVLVIEDEKATARALELKLLHEGFEVQRAFDGVSALKMLEKETFDLILCDLVLPKIDGFQVLEGIKEKKIAAPVIVLTNLSQEEDEKRAHSLGATAFFVKSNVSIAEIVERVKSLL